MSCGTAPACVLRGRSGRTGFTLIETMVALVIFGVISFAISIVLSAAFRTQQLTQRQQDEAGTVRGVFGFLTRDIQAAFASSTNPASVFIAKAGAQGTGGSGLLILATRNHRIEAPGLGIDPNQNQNGGMPNPSAGQNAVPTPPQSDVDLVRYDFDPTNGTLSRTATPVPNLQSIAQTGGNNASILGRRIVSISLIFSDATNGNTRTDWDFQQRNLKTPDDQSNGSNGSNGSNASANGNTPNSGNSQGNTGQNGSQTNNGSGDQTLPTAVEVRLTMVQEDGSQTTYSTLIPILAPKPLPRPATPDSNGSNTGGNGNSGTPTGGNGGNNGTSDGGGTNPTPNPQGP